MEKPEFWLRFPVKKLDFGIFGQNNLPQTHIKSRIKTQYTDPGCHHG